MLDIARLALIALLLWAGAAAAQVADLRITSTGPAQVLPASQFQWTITIDNAGPAAADGATFSSPVPSTAGVPVLTPISQCTATGGAVCGTINSSAGGVGGILTSTIPTLPAGGRITISVTATAPGLLFILTPIAPPMITTASVQPPAGVTDPDASNNQTQFTTVVLQADLVVSVTHVGSFQQGQTGAVYTLVVSNVGALTHFGMVFLSDVLPPGLTATAMSGTGWSCNVTSCSRSSSGIAPGASLPPVTLVVNVSPNAPAQVVNQAIVNGIQNQFTNNDVAFDITGIVPIVPAVIPTTSPWALVVLAGLLLTGFRRLRRI